MCRASRVWVQALWVVVLWTMPGAREVAWAQGAHTAEIQELMTLSGVHAALDQIPDSVRAQMAQRKGELPPSVEAKLASLLLDVYQPAKLKASFAEALEANYDVEAFGAAKAWLKAPLGKRLVQLEVESSTAEGQQKLAVWSQDFGGTPPTPERAQLVGRLLRASNGVGLTVEAVVTVMEPLVQTVNALAPEDQQQSQEDIEALLEDIRQQLINPMAEQLVVTGLYIYRDVPDAELIRYAEFLESPQGAAYQERVNVALISALQSSNGQFAERFAELFE